MDNTLSLSAYYAEYNRNIEPKWLFSQLGVLKSKILETKAAGGKIIFAGNGASAAIASHVALDFTKQAGVRSVTFHDPGLITAFVNDFGAEFWLSRACDMYADPNDLAIFISVSGQSPNVVNAARELAVRGIETISFTGKTKDNNLGQAASINFWVDSHAYNIVECIHMIWITTVIDMIIGKSEYSVS
jgi:D-sedoheptulose 7-phosphate isomerase